ncbi:MAG: DUF5050 domain-containing protein [Lachnospiraceae bacterium]|nr:DUF5050 domain-containing protein [Lachnospiraceae bacterium]
MAKKKNGLSPAFYIVSGIVLLLLFAAVIYYVFFASKMEMNPAGTVGNTAGNLNNAGLFCEHNGTVYFSNPRDGGALYAMNADESNIRKLYAMSVRNILAGGDYLYYFQMNSSDVSGFASVVGNHSFNRSHLDGSQSVALTKDVVTNGQLIDNYLYLQTAGSGQPSFYKLKIDKSEQVKLADYTVNPACAEDGIFYYNGTRNDHALYQWNTANDSTSLIWNGNLWYPVLDGNYIYYMDVSAKYRLCRFSLSSQEIEILTNDHVDCFNVGNGFIYYQTNAAVSPQLKCMHTDGSNSFVLADGVFTNINMTSQYVYFQQFGVDGSLYHARLGSDSYRIFGE